ncbi:MAG: hypothetical protein RMK80_04585 [Pseudobdellovibrionaceae bacterium]|nr:hypothetical protein [Pseudobdellovibrionaceae bacterium]
MEHTNVFQRHLMPLSVDLASVGKWILTGEHAVLRGVPALVFPLTSRRLFIKGELHLLPGEDTALEQCQLEFGGEFGRDLQPLFYEIFKKALDLIPKGPKFVVKGHLKIISELPLGAGLGTSASLSVALGRIFWNLGLVKEEELFSWATSLEHFFHGESSGVDVAAVLHQAPLLYSRYGGLKVCRFSYFPPISLHYVGTKGYTRDCVAKVKEV